MSRSFTDWQEDFLAHHGVRGQRWGTRRYQNEDGSLTAEGERHYYSWGKNDYQSLRSKRLNRKGRRLNHKAYRLVKKLANEYGNDEKKIQSDKRIVKYERKAEKFNKKLDRSIASDFRKQKLRDERRKKSVSMAKKTLLAIGANKLAKQGNGTKGQKLVKSILLYKIGKRIVT